MGGEDFSTVQYMYVRHLLPAIMLIFQGQKNICASLYHNLQIIGIDL